MQRNAYFERSWIDTSAPRVLPAIVAKISHRKKTRFGWMGRVLDSCVPCGNRVGDEPCFFPDKEEIKVCADFSAKIRNKRKIEFKIDWLIDRRSIESKSDKRRNRARFEAKERWRRWKCLKRWSEGASPFQRGASGNPRARRKAKNCIIVNFKCTADSCDVCVCVCDCGKIAKIERSIAPDARDDDGLIDSYGRDAKSLKIWMILKIVSGRSLELMKLF